MVTPVYSPIVSTVKSITRFTFKTKDQIAYLAISHPHSSSGLGSSKSSPKDQSVNKSSGFITNISRCMYKKIYTLHTVSIIKCFTI